MSIPFANWVFDSGFNFWISVSISLITSAIELKLSIFPPSLSTRVLILSIEAESAVFIAVAMSLKILRAVVNPSILLGFFILF